MTPEDLGIIDRYFGRLLPKFHSSARTVAADWASLGGGRLAMVKGAFDLIHPGHLFSIMSARDQADGLVVAVASDASISARKGSDRPIRTWWERGVGVAALEAVDYVVAYDGLFPVSAAAEAMPSVVLASHFDYLTPEDLSLLRSSHIELVVLRKPPFKSTSDHVRTIRESG